MWLSYTVIAVGLYQQHICSYYFVKKLNSFTTVKILWNESHVFCLFIKVTHASRITGNSIAW